MPNKIANAAQKAAATTQSSPLAQLKAALDTENCKRQLAETMRENAGAFSASIIELFKGDKYLAQCAPAEVISECFKAASLKLPINKQLGFAYVIAYKDNKDGCYHPQFQLGYKGYIQLAQRSGAYRCINCDVVYEGEFVARNKLTGDVDLSGERTSDQVVGYFAYIETLNGFSKTLYMTYDEVLAHARKRSKTYFNGKFSGPWATDFDAMAMKTCVRLLISKYGIMSIDMERAVVSEYSIDDITAPDDTSDIPDVEDNGAPQNVNLVTGEVIDNAE